RRARSARLPQEDGRPSFGENLRICAPHALVSTGVKPQRRQEPPLAAGGSSQFVGVPRDVKEMTRAGVRAGDTGKLAVTTHLASGSGAAVGQYGLGGATQGIGMTTQRRRASLVHPDTIAPSSFAGGWPRRRDPAVAADFA